jgi:hypothetical protein
MVRMEEDNHNQPCRPEEVEGKSFWTAKLVRRLIALPEGRHQVILSKERDTVVTWTVTTLGKIER